MGFSFSPDLSARDSNIGPRACRICRGLIDRMMTKTSVCHIDTTEGKKLHK